VELTITSDFQWDDKIHRIAEVSFRLKKRKILLESFLAFLDFGGRC
jgi:hypothetical protein